MKYVLQHIILKINIISLNDSNLEFDIIGIDSAIANALRRIMIAEVPTMAIEHVFIAKNTSIVHDEVLAQRLGLLPIIADPAEFDFPNGKLCFNEYNSIVFRINVFCEKIEGKIDNKNVFSSSLVWLPHGSEMPEETSCYFSSNRFKTKSAFRPIYNDILLAVLSPGQEIILEAHCCKGIGKIHVKWSPVVTQWYRLRPEITLLQEVYENLAKALTIELPGLVKMASHNFSIIRNVGNARFYELLIAKFRRLSREYRWAPYLQLKKVKNHFFFKIETSGVLKVWDIFVQALDILLIKVDKVLVTLL
jgi:DNA-directed RNA polymerase I and III subunit RPAC1